MSPIIDHFAFVYCSVLKYDYTVSCAFIAFDFAKVNFVFSDSADFDSLKVLFQLIYKFFIEGFVELGKELVDLEFGQFISPQEGILGVIFV